MEQDNMDMQENNQDTDLSKSQLETSITTFNVDKLMNSTGQLKKFQLGQQSYVNRQEQSENSTSANNYKLAISAIDINSKVPEEHAQPLQFLSHQNNNSPSDQQRNSSPIFSSKERFSNQIYQSPRGSQSYEISPNVIARQEEVYAQNIDQTGIQAIDTKEQQHENIQELYKQMQTLQQIIYEYQLQNKKIQSVQSISQPQSLQLSTEQSVQQFNLFDICSIFGYIIVIIANVVSLIDVQKYKVELNYWYNIIMLNLTQIFLGIILTLNFVPLKRLNALMQKQFYLAKNYLFNSIVLFLMISTFQMNYNIQKSIIWTISSVIMLLATIPCTINFIFFLLIKIQSSQHIRIEKRLLRSAAPDIDKLSKSKLIIKKKIKSKAPKKQKKVQQNQQINQQNSQQPIQQQLQAQPRLLPTSAVGMDNTLFPGDPGWNQYYEMQQTVEFNISRSHSGELTPSLDVL